MKAIQGKTAYWGRHTFEASADEVDGKPVTRISVFRNCPKKYEASYFIKNKKDILKLSKDESSAFRFYTGHLGGNTFGKTEYVKTIDSFVKCFKHKTEKD